MKIIYYIMMLIAILGLTTCTKDVRPQKEPQKEAAKLRKEIELDNEWNEWGWEKRKRKEIELKTWEVWLINGPRREEKRKKLRKEIQGLRKVVRLRKEAEQKEAVEQQWIEKKEFELKKKIQRKAAVVLKKGLELKRIEKFKLKLKNEIRELESKLKEWKKGSKLKKEELKKELKFKQQLKKELELELELKLIHKTTKPKDIPKEGAAITFRVW